MPVGVARKQRIQSSHIPPCHRHMVIATNLSLLFDLLHCSIPQTRTRVTVFRPTRFQNHFATLGLEPLTHLFHEPDTEDRAGPIASTGGGPASNPEGTVLRVLGAFQVCSLP